MRHELKVPSVGESIQEVQIGKWLRREGQSIGKDENLVEIESDKATVDLPSPIAGTVTKILHATGDVVAIGTVIGYMEESAPAEKAAAPAAPAPTAAAPAPTAPPTIPTPTAPAPQAAAPTPAAVRPVPPPPPAPKAAEAATPARVSAPEPTPAPPEKPAEKPITEKTEKSGGSQLVHTQSDGRPAEISAMQHGAAPRSEEIVPMSRLRKLIAERLVQAKNTGALLTTFNEVDMSAVINLRQQYKEVFQERYSAKLGFMSFFVKAAIESLKGCPELNAEIRDTSIVYRHFYDISIAVGGGKGLVVPVIRNAELLNFAQVEQKIADFGARAKSGQLKPDELMGGTFTITNGGVFGSMLSTPIINPPQSGILGLHAIQDRVVARDGQVVIRPMMYIALTYDHRIVDGREAVGFLVRVKEYIEDPTRLLLQI